MKCTKCIDGYVLKDITPRDEWNWLEDKYHLYAYDICPCCGGDYHWCETCEIELNPLEN